MEKSTNEKDILLKILKIEGEQKRREKYRNLEKYNSGNKVHKKQMEFHRELKRNRWVFGGNRSGKTECGAVEAVWIARGNHPYRENRPQVTGWVVSLSYEVQREVAQAKILHYLKPEWIVEIGMTEGKKASPEYGIIDYIVIKNVFGNTSKIIFKSCEAGREKFQGASLDFVWFDEEPPEDIYTECKMRLLDKKGDLFGTMTPLKGLTFIYYEIFLNEKCDPEVWYTQMEWADNPYLDEGEIKLFESTLSKESLETRKYGRFHSSTGLVYTEFNENIHIIDPFSVPKDWQDNISIDPGLNNPLSCHFYAVDFDNTVYVIAEHYESGQPVSYHAEKIRKMAEQLDWKRGAGGYLNALIDSAASQRTLASTKSVAELFYEEGISVNTKVNKDLWSGIARVKEYFQSTPPRIYIFKNCTNLIRELKGYWWGEGDTPKKRDDHALDELRYYLMTKPNNPAPVKDKGLIFKDKNKKMRALSLKSY